MGQRAERTSVITHSEHLVCGGEVWGGVALAQRTGEFAFFGAERLTASGSNSIRPSSDTVNR